MYIDKLFFFQIHFYFISLSGKKLKMRICSIASFKTTMELSIHGQFLVYRIIRILFLHVQRTHSINTCRILLKTLSKWPNEGKLGSTNWSGSEMSCLTPSQNLFKRVLMLRGRILWSHDQCDWLSQWSHDKAPVPLSPKHKRTLGAVGDSLATMLGACGKHTLRTETSVTINSYVWNGGGKAHPPCCY